MDKDLRAGLQARAKSLGFDSSQALLRYVAKAIIDDRMVTFGQDNWGEPPEHVLKHWEEEVADLPRQLKTGEAKKFDNIDDLMADLNG